MSYYHKQRGYTQVEFVPKSSDKGEDSGNNQEDFSSKKQLSTGSEEFKLDDNQKANMGQSSKKGGKPGNTRNAKPKGQPKGQYENSRHEYDQNADQQYKQPKQKNGPNKQSKTNQDTNRQPKKYDNSQNVNNDAVQQNEQGRPKPAKKNNNKPRKNNKNPEVQNASEGHPSDNNRRPGTSSHNRSKNRNNKGDEEETKTQTKKSNNRPRTAASSKKQDDDTVSGSTKTGMDNFEDDDDDEEVKEIEDLSHIPRSELGEILQDRFKRSKIECPICFNRIKKDAKLWSCVQCYGPFHLGCIHRWITKNPINANKGKDQKYFNWSCPKCNYAYTEELPEYKCFCSKVTNPEFDPYGMPHSCGGKCMKIPIKGCVHPCTLECHPGPCPPCNKFGKELKCYCGNKKALVKCSNPTTGFTCNEVCNKTLSCGKHKCQQICHEGPCPECEITVERECYCGAKAEDRKCGDEEFSCGGRCNKKQDCGNHKCQAICHPGPCDECPYTPEKMTTCCCGRMSTMALGLDNRKSCLDPIPVCGLPCGKILPCGHKCKQSCHPGECGKCHEMVEQKCRCARNDRKIECWKTRDGDESERLFLCERLCRKHLSCKKHKCQRLCCEATKGNDPHGHHLCLKVCGKPLSCGNHECQDFCHLGDCRPCPIIINHPLSCVCGKTVRNPPLQCGARPPECDFPCSRQRECGHPCHSKCHYDECLPCDEPVEKKCKCGKKLIKNAKCSFPASCGWPCETVLACGHKCGIVCHSGECNMERGLLGCGAKCGKIRQCGHKCEAPCHPKEETCPDIPCKVLVSLKCDCGNREVMIKCGEKVEKKLECDRSCATMKRFGGFFKKTTTQKSYFPPTLVRFAKTHLSYLLGIEERLERMFKEGKEMIDIPLYDRNMGKKSALSTLISRHYNMDLEYYLHVKNPTIVVKLNDDSKMPPMNLSEYLRQIETGKITPEILPFEATVKFFDLAPSDRSIELDMVLKAFKGEYYVERGENQQLVAHFWRKEIAEEAINVLKKSYTNFAQAVLEVNLALKAEEEKLESTQKDVKVNDEKVKDKGDKTDFVFLSLNNQ